LAKFIEDEKEILKDKCERAFTEIRERIENCATVGQVDAVYRDFTDHTILGDYSASSRAAQESYK